AGTAVRGAISADFGGCNADTAVRGADSADCGSCSADTAVRGADSADCGGCSADTAVPTCTYDKKNRPCCPKTTRPALFAWQRPTLPGPCGPSTIGAGGLNGRVRDGNAWFPSAIATKRQRFRCYRSL